MIDLKTFDLDLNRLITGSNYYDDVDTLVILDLISTPGSWAVNQELGTNFDEILKYITNNKNDIINSMLEIFIDKGYNVKLEDITVDEDSVYINLGNNAQFIINKYGAYYAGG